MYRILYIPNGTYFPLEFDDYIHACDWIRQSAFIYQRLTSTELPMPLFQVVTVDKRTNTQVFLEIYTLFNAEEDLPSTN